MALASSHKNYIRSAIPDPATADKLITLLDELTPNSDGLIISSLPTANPQVVGALWADNGTVKVSAG